ncbi:MAG: HAMP domain-containing sensor histidine kinase [Dehalococcoidia bacterium]|nr:Phosphate regulon sensor protein PhoR [Chloroflexota bacterium]MBT9162270.1 Phosphate regulon sensor protein PhoR [Chloroflexota bacterium]
MRISLRQQIFLWYALMVPLIMMGLAFVLHQVMIAGLYDAIDNRLRDRTTVVARTIVSSPEVSSEAYGDLVNWLIEHQLPYIPAVLRVSDSQRNILASFGDIPNRLLPLMDRQLLLPELDEGRFETIRKRGHEALRLYTVPVRDPTIGDIIAFVQTGDSLVAIAEAQNKLWRYTIVVGIGGSAVALTAGSMVFRRGFRPLDKILKMVREIGGKDLAIRIPEEPRPQELQQLADTLNSMMQRLHAAFTTRETFFASVSHDLRTPLTVLQGQIDILLMQPSLDLEVRQRLSAMAREVRRLSRMTNNLLLSVQMEAIPAFIGGEVDLKELLEEIAREARVLAQGLHFSVSIPEIMVIAGDYDLLKQMLLNVVDNAIKFTPQTGSVTVGLSQVGEWAAITVSDTGRGMPPEKLVRLAEPVNRTGMPRKPGGQGTGLGLTIVKQIVDLHGGEMEIQSQEGSGTTVAIRLPLQPKRQSR